MYVEEPFEYCHKFSFPLKARTERKIMLEAKKKLASSYPFDVSEKNLLVTRSREKGVYDVYVSKNEFRKKKRISRVAFLSLGATIVLAISVLAIRRVTEVGEEAVRLQKEAALKETEDKKIRYEKEKKLEDLKNELSKMQNESYDKIYPCIERIYSVMGKGSTIENISIERSLFSVEATADDAMRILRNFEENENFSSIRMNRTTVNGSKETVTYTGSFSRLWKEADAGMTMDEKIEFYETETMNIKERKKRQAELSLSEYIRGIREILRKNNCNERYIQIHINGETAEVEFFTLSSSRSILDFISEVQEKNDNLIDIKKLHIRNGESSDRVQMTICFDSGTRIKQGEEFLYRHEEEKIPAEEVNKIFYKQTTRPPIYDGKRNNASFSAQASRIPASKGAVLKRLSYLGRTRVNGKEYVMAKDEDMGIIYKFLVSETETGGNFCMENGGGYKARIHGENYEVIK